jgi:hypothetical protein
MPPPATTAMLPNCEVKSARPIAPPIWRTSELSPVASVILWRGIFVSATVVNGTNRQANATPCTASGNVMSLVPDSSVSRLS